MFRVVIRVSTMLALMLTSLISLPVSVQASAIAVCPADQAALVTAIANAGAGGTMTFTCDVTLAITETVPLTNVTLDGNGHTVVLDGGGSDRILSVSGPEPVSVIGLTFSNGSASGVGGGAITVDTTGNLTVTDSTFRNNSAIGVLGGAILNDGTLVVRGSTFENNEAGAGGAISNYGIGSPVSPILTVEASTFSDNYANSGGAIDSASGTVNITGSTFDSNSGGNGGGAFSAKNTTTTVTNSTFVSNTGSFGAVFFLHSGGDIAVTNSTLLNNWATTGGSAVYAKAGAAVTVTNTILAQPDFGAENCLIYTDDDASLTNGGGNFATDRSCDTPITGVDDLHLASLANNGGPTETVALLPGSVAIGAANHDVCMAAPVGGIDQRGNARGPYICDSGAYDTGSQEHDVTPPIITYTMTGERGSNAWWKSDVTLTWSVVEPQSPDTLVITDCVDQHITSDQTLVYYSCAASSLGGTASIVTVYIRRDATPPVVTVNGVQDGATYVEGSVPATSCTTTDPMAGVRNQSTLSLSGTAPGQITATCSGGTDFAGNTASASVTYTVNDANNVPPSVSYALDPTAATGENGWYAGDVSLTWTIENLTDPSIVSGCEDQTITADQIMTLYTCYASTAAGASGTVEVQIGRDTTAPHVTVTGVLNGAEYIEDAVPAAGCSTTDATAGVQTEATADTSGGPLGLVTVTCSGGEDNAGNVAANVVITYTVTSTSESTDTTPPQIVPVITPATPTGDNGWYTGPVSFYWNVTEPESPESVVVTGCVGASYIGDLTMHSFSCSASSDGGTAPTMTINIGLDQTAPVVSVTGVTDGATYTALPTPGCTTTDAVSGVATDATLSITGGPTGTVTATCSGAKDNAGNIGSASATYTVQTVDTTPPIIVPTVNGTLGTSGWYTSDVEVSWSVVDDESDISASTGCDASTITTDTTGTTLTCEATSEGGTNSESVTIKRDATAPVVTVTGVENGATYTQGSVPAASCSTTDATSGVETNAHVSITGGPLGSVTAMCLDATDNAGNSAGAVSATYMILAADSTAPVIDYVLNPTTPSGLLGWYTGNVTLTWTVIDTETPDTVSQVGCANQTITADQAKATYSCSATSDGGTAAQVNVVIGRDATPPVVTVTGVTNDASYTYGAVPTAGCTTSDATSGVATQATLSLTGGPLGSVTAQCLGATDNAGNANAAVVTYTVIDGTPPVVTYTLTPSTPTGENGWYTSNISLTWTVVENESPESLNTYGCVDRTFTADQAKVTYFCQAVSPGGDSGAVSVDVGRDTTPPQVGVTGVADGATYIYGQVPTAGCSTTDATSGVATNATLSMIGGPLGQVTARCAGAMDNAGHTSSAGVTFTVLDDTSPDITPSIIGTIGANGWYTSDVTLTWTVTDTDTPDTVQVTGCDDQTITADQIKTSYSCTATSEGGTTGPVEVTIGRDATAPIAAVTGVEDGATYLYEHVPALGCTTTDSTSGVQTEAALTTSGGPVGEITATCAGAVDNAGNVGSASATYTVHYDWQGFVSTTDDRRGPRKTLAGMPVTVVFMINGDVGLDAVESITTIACNAAPGTQPTPAASQGRREPLQQGSANTFIFRWQTTRSMAGTCQELRVTLADGTTWSQTYQFQR